MLCTMQFYCSGQTTDTCMSLHASKSFISANCAFDGVCMDFECLFGI